ncbi:GDSL family lipase [Stakelama sp. CBK3Z-3]|uniref:GDSL family lipase n=1 Tax=Stakelama flava TaxID=2860338 RepID=A0ABS6XHE0_9SPHN|nr:GDSL-type esterase/lipase family protein [Stakelama flava]MBW4329639.1 GDSL family lipase [Stakelama flava]
MTGRKIGGALCAVALAFTPQALAATQGDSTPKAAEPVFQNSPERREVKEKDWGPWLGPFREKLVPSLMQDFGERYLYIPANRKLAPPKPDEDRVVFMGDSITDRWDLHRNFGDKPYINRGIGSQVTAQMVLRFQQDVVQLHPRVVVILAGVNDVQGFLQKETPETIEQNYEAMADIADRHGIAVVFGSLLPVNNYSEQAHDVLKERDPAELRQLNSWLKGFCHGRGYAYADYYSALVDQNGLMKRELTVDGVHPLRAGYAIMAPIAQAAIDQALVHSHERKSDR